MFNTNISIEEMAAYLDGNLSESEMENISAIIGQSNDMQMFSQVNNHIEDEVSKYTSHDIELPLELQSLDFELPSFDDVTMDFESTIDGISSQQTCIAACCCDDDLEDLVTSNSEEIIQGEESLIEDNSLISNSSDSEDMADICGSSTDSIEF